MRAKLGVVLVAMVLVGGCGGGDKSPAEKCDDLVSLACDRIVECIAGASGMHEACVQEFEKDLTCSSVKSVGASYDSCVDQLEGVSCTTLFPASGGGAVNLPASCNSVLQEAAPRDPAIGRVTPFSDAVRVMTSAAR